ncbi:MAG: hypothetical protein ACXAC5_07615 [Promethearchaeota archaeon]|jgi:hypothetical protein
MRENYENINSNEKIVNIIKILEKILDIVKNTETDLTWSRFNTVDELIDELLDHVKRLMRRDFSKLDSLILLFAPTASLQDISVSSGWGSLFISISETLDKAIEELKREFHL